MMYVCSSVARKKKKKKFILPIDEKSGRYIWYEGILELDLTSTAGVNLLEIQNKKK
jgi:hypothetical protein